MYHDSGPTGKSAGQPIPLQRFQERLVPTALALPTARRHQHSGEVARG